MAGISVGIDLGTTNSCIAIYRNKKVEIVRDEYGNAVIPSIVTFTGHCILVGDETHMYIDNNTVHEVNRLLGQNFLDEDVQRAIKYFPYKVINDNGTPKIEIATLCGTKAYRPEEINAFILEKLKSNVEKYINDTVERVVVTVPTYFNEIQRDATKKAALLAGFKTVDIIYQPTAAAIAFNYPYLKSDMKNILIYNFDESTFDVSIARINKSFCEIKASSGDKYLGGHNIVLNMVRYVINDFKTKFGNNLLSDVTATMRIKNVCKKAKEALSRNYLTTISLCLLEGHNNYETTISRLKFEHINKDLFEKTINIVKECLVMANLNKNDIKEVLLVGGSSRIPKIQEMLSDIFGREKLNNSLNPYECIAHGAALYRIGNSIEVQDITALSLGTGTNGKYNYCNNLVKRVVTPHNRSITVSKSSKCFTTDANQTSALIRATQVESELKQGSCELGKSLIQGFTKPLAGETQTHVDVSSDDHSSIGKRSSECTEINIEEKRLLEDGCSKVLSGMNLESCNTPKKDRCLSVVNEVEDLCLQILSDPTDKYDHIDSEINELLTCLEAASLDDLTDIEEKSKHLLFLINNS